MTTLDLTGNWVGIASLLIFAVAYAAVMGEEHLHLRKSQPVLVAAGLIWLLVGAAFAVRGEADRAAEAARHNLLEFAELFLFLLVAMTYVNTMQERGVFDWLRAWLVRRGYTLRALFWVTGGLAFMISPVADNLTTALLMGAVAMAVGQGHPRFVTLACINVVVAANAGGAFSPFGDITTLMVWQAGRLGFFAFFAIFLPSLVNWLVPAALMAPAVERVRPQAMAEAHDLEPGALPVVALFLGTITLTVAAHTFLHLPPAVGMMAGLGVLKMYGYLFNEAARRAPKVAPAVVAAVAPAAAGMSRDGGPDPMARRAGIDPEEDARRSAAVDEMDDVFAVPHLRPEPRPGAAPQQLRTAELAEAPLPSEVSDREAGRAAAPARLVRARPLDIFKRMEQVEWDTLMFFYGVILCVGGLGTFGYLALASRLLYEGLGATAANVLVGLLSAVIDNVPVMFAVLAMNPAMSQGQWLLVTLTAGVGGSLLSIGSAAGVALMGQARGVYTFGSHLRWAWAIALGYAASIGAHLLLNRHLF